MNIKTKRGASSMNADELLLNLQGHWQCIDVPHFLLHIKGDTISVNNGTPQKIILERFDSSWSFYLRVFIPNIKSPLTVSIDRVIVESFEYNLFSNRKKFAFSTIYPAEVKTFNDMDFHDNTIFRFKQS